ncbi:MAG: SseB family protein, partial [Dorea sp.]|nr:SseB family protein [Dorea sp.]
VLLTQARDRYGVKMEKDKNLLGNELIEDAIAAMYKNLTDEKLARVFSVLRNRMLDGGHLIVSVKAGENNRLELRPVVTGDGKTWFAAYTKFDEELKARDPIHSGFTAEISKLFAITLQTEEVDGIIINPWGKALKLDKNMIRLIFVQ